MNSPDVSQARPWTSVFTAEELETYENYRRPGRKSFPWATSALLVIDVTREFLGRNAPSLEASRELRTACGAPAWEAIGPIKSLLAAYRAAARPVIYTRGATGVMGGAAIGAVDMSETSEIADDIRPQASELVIAKPRASAFFGTALTTFLVREGITGLVIVGGSTSGCVRATVVDGSSLGFSMTLAHDGCFDRSALSHAVALQELDVKYGTVTDSGAVVARMSDMSSDPAIGVSAIS